MNVNAKTCIRTLIEHSRPIERMLDYQIKHHCETIPVDIFQAYVRDLLQNIKVQHKGSQNLSRILNEATESYSLAALQRHDYVIVDEGNRAIALNGFIDSLFRHIVDKMLIKPIPERKFRQHEKTLGEIIKDCSAYNAKSKSEREVEIEYIQEFLRGVKSDFSSNLLAIETHSDNLSQLIEKDEAELSKRELMAKIVELCDKYIEPFFRFLQASYKRSSFIEKMGQLQEFFARQGFVYEANDINRFIIHFRKYIDEIKVIYDRVNSYRRKGKQDLRVFNAFEKAFHDMSDASLSVLDGKRVANKLESSGFHKMYTQLDGMLDSKRRVMPGLNADHIIRHFSQIENKLLIEVNQTDKMEEREVDEEMLARLAKEQAERNRITKKQREDKNLINAILRRYQKYLRTPSQEDLMLRVYKVLRKHLPEDIFSGYVVLMAYFHMRSSHVRNVEIGFNRRRYFIDEKNHIKYIYRPVYAK